MDKFKILAVAAACMTLFMGFSSFMQPATVYTDKPALINAAGEDMGDTTMLPITTGKEPTYAVGDFITFQPFIQTSGTSFSCGFGFDLRLDKIITSIDTGSGFTQEQHTIAPNAIITVLNDGNNYFDSYTGDVSFPIPDIFSVGSNLNLIVETEYSYSDGGVWHSFPGNPFKVYWAYPFAEITGIGDDPGDDPVDGTGNLVVNTGRLFTEVSISGPTSEVITTTLGIADFENIPPGTYTITIAASGFNTQTKSGTVVAGEITTITLSDSSWVAIGELPPNEDTDNDGMADSWEMTYFGNLAQSADADYDGDGYSNIQEYALGTDPTDRTSAEGYTWSDYGYIAAIGGVLIAVMVFAMFPMPPKFKGFISIAIALAGLVVAHLLNTGVI